MGGWVVPGIEPFILVVIEVVCSFWTGVGPWLSTLTIWEVSVGSTDGDVENEEELLVEWSTLLRLVLPWVVNISVETTLGEHVLIKCNIEN
jgi:hypothetical protein